jgi:outer membrane protein assembly factor BamB
MYLTESSPLPGTPRRSLLRRVVRVGFPQVVITLAAFLYFATSIRAGHHIERQWFNLFRTCVLAVAAGLLAIWAVFLSGWRKPPTVLALLFLAGGAVACLRIEYDGDLRPSLHPRDWLLRLFGSSHEDEVEAHRRRQAETLAKRPIDLTPGPDDFPGFRGADRTGVVAGPPLARDWNANPSRVVWKQPTYGGHAAFAVVNGFLFTMEQRRDQEAVVCYDAANGNELWATAWPARFEERMGGDGPRATPTVDGGNVFALGALGRLVCLDGATGNLKWSVETLRGSKNLTWAMAGSPLVVGDLVIVNPGRQDRDSNVDALVAFDRHDGRKVWGSGKTQAGYASPMLARLGGRTQILLFDGAGLGGYDPDGGAQLWRFPWRTQGSDGINVAQPLVLETEDGAHKGEVFIASAYGRGGALLHIEEGAQGWTVEEVWRTDRASMRCKVSSPVRRGDFIYGLDDGNLECIRVEDGRRVWKDERHAEEGGAYGQGQLLLSGDLLVVLTHYGEVVLVEATPERFHELGRLKVLAGNKTWNTPALAGGRLYIRNHLEMACVDLR